MGGEAGVSIGDDFLWQSEPSVNIVEVHLRDVGAHDSGGARDEGRRS
jgi:hypothetical protein